MFEGVGPVGGVGVGGEGVGGSTLHAEHFIALASHQSASKGIGVGAGVAGVGAGGVGVGGGLAPLVHHLPPHPDVH